MAEMIDLDTYYGRTNSEVSKHEALEYMDIERAVRFYYEGGKSPVNDYVYSANLLVNMVFSRDEEDWLAEFFNWRREMQKEKAGTRTIERIGVRLWPTIFRAFYFAADRWKKEEYADNVHKLLRLYWSYMLYKEEQQQEGRDKNLKKDWPNGIQREDRFYVFLQEFIPAWEMLRDTESLNYVFSHIVKMPVDRNYNQQSLFFKFVYQSVYCLHYLGYLFRTDPWEMKLSGKVHDEKEKKQCQMLLRQTAVEIQSYIDFLQNHDKVLQNEMKMYQNAKNYIDFIQTIMDNKISADIKEKMPFNIRVSESGTEELTRISKIEDNKAFYRAVDGLVGEIAVTRLISFMKQREIKANYKADV